MATHLLKQKLALKALLFFGILSVVYLTGWYIHYSGFAHPISCDVFVADELHHADFKTLAKGGEVNWIAREFHLPKFLIKANASYAFDHVFFRWKRKGSSYNLDYHNDRIRLTQRWDYAKVTIADMRRCLGDPDVYLNIRYDAYHGQVQEYNFFFHKQQLAVSGSIFFPDETLVITKDTSVTGVSKLPYHDFRDRVAAFAVLSSDILTDEYLTAARPWPPNFIEIDEEPTVFDDFR